MRALGNQEPSLDTLAMRALGNQELRTKNQEPLSSRYDLDLSPWGAGEWYHHS